MASAELQFSEGLRLATPEDISVLAGIMKTGAATTEEDQYCRPYAPQHSTDTYLHFRAWFTQLMHDDDTILLVIEDDLKETDDYTPSEGERGVVGFAHIKLSSNHPRSGRLGTDWADLPCFSAPQQRPQVHHEHELVYHNTINELEAEHFQDCDITLETLIVDPDYRRRGHGGKLVQWLKDLANTDNVNVGVIATRDGIPLYRQHGFRGLADANITGDEVSPQGVTIKAMKYVSDNQTTTQTQENEITGSFEVLPRHMVNNLKHKGLNLASVAFEQSFEQIITRLHTLHI